MVSHGPLYLSIDLDSGGRGCLGGCFLTVHALFSIYFAFSFILPSSKELFRSAFFFAFSKVEATTIFYADVESVNGYNSVII